MQIHVVKKGQTLKQIAQMYNTKEKSIINANEIPAPYKLVVGEALVIPIIGQFYFVKSGDTLFSIAQKFGLNARELAKMNGISLNQALYVRQKIYIPPLPKRKVEMNAYIESYSDKVNPNLVKQLKIASPYLTYLAPFSFKMMRDGSLQPPPLDDFINIARNDQVVVMMVVSNLEKGQFSAELGRAILSNENLQNKLLDNIIKTAKNYQFKDIHFDMEYLPPEEKENYVKFLKKAKLRLENQGLMMSVALAPKTSSTQKGAWYEAHDYRAIGAIADFVVLMTYEWGYSGGPPMPVSPINEVKKVLDYAVTTMPSTKILMGQNLYGYDWTLPYVPGGKYAKAISPQQAIELARIHNVAIEYDAKAQAPHFSYTDKSGKKHTVWFEDARSIQAKFNLVKQMNLRGVSYWKLGLSFPQNWLLIDSNFNVVKLI